MTVNVAAALKRWRNHRITVKTVERKNNDRLELVEIVTGDYVWCMVQPTKRTDLNADTLDWSKEHINLYSYEPITIGKIVEHRGKDFKVVDFHDWEEYGYCKAVCAHTNKRVLEVDQYV